MAYDLEKEKREAVDAGNRALRSLRAAQDNLNSAKNWEFGICLVVDLCSTMAKPFQNGSGKAKHGAGKI